MKRRSKSAQKLISLERMGEAAECLRTLAHPHRLRMVQILLREERTVGDLADACGIASHVASEHLRRMRDRGLLECRHDGRKRFYSVAESGLKSIMGCIEVRFGGSAASSSRAKHRSR